MLNKYYYLGASLPYVSFGDDPPFSREGFIAECKKWLSPADMQALLSADLHCREEKCEGIPLLRRWKSFDTAMKAELARIRAATKKGEGYKTFDILKNIMGKETPLLMERALEKLRWIFIEECSKQYFYDINALASYFLKVQILERLATFNKDEGEKFFYSLCEVKYE